MLYPWKGMHVVCDVESQQGSAAPGIADVARLRSSADENKQARGKRDYLSSR
jgi:hypothetical protein